jgi:16S rRNA (guanine966-N2)-methyltransferase
VVAGGPGRVRVIGGTLRGRRLTVPKGIRPTADRVREAIFSSLGDAVVGSAVLDLYAGTGAFAVEAMSRGARCALVVDRDHAAIEACQANLRHLEQAPVGHRWRVVRSPVSRFLGGGPPPEAPFELVFLDPPYETGLDEVRGVLDRLAEPGWCAPEARVVVERPARTEALDVPGWMAAWERRYGDTLVVVLRCAD